MAWTHIDGYESDQYKKIIRVLYSSYSNRGRQPSHYHLLRPHVEVIKERPTYNERESDNTYHESRRENMVNSLKGPKLYNIKHKDECQ
eukprot:3520193-Heterocapsa_arctica.AAC.1